MKKTAFLFPGQGTQFVRMATDHPFFDVANYILDYDIEDICQNGPIEGLNSTLVSQPAIFVCSAIILDELEALHPNIVPHFAAGLSLGECTALYAAKVLSFEDALKLIQIRAELMQEAADNSKGGMVSIMGLDDDTVYEVCREASGGQYLTLSNFNSPTQIVISGDIGACDRAIVVAKEYGAIAAIKLNVEGAFHSKMMSSAVDKFREVVYETDMEFPSDIKIVSNIDGEYYDSLYKIREGLISQLTNPAMWQRCVERLIKDGVEEFYEVGPKRTLTGLMKRIDRSQKITNVVELLGR